MGGPNGTVDGTNFWTILIALQNEGMTEEAAEVIEIMKARAITGVRNQCRFYSCQPGDDSTECKLAKSTTNGIVDRGNDKPGCHWYLEQNITSPWIEQTGLPGAGSEFAWDTTGQEEAYIWGAYFNASALAASALNQILAYTPLVPNWCVVQLSLSLSLNATGVVHRVCILYWACASLHTWLVCHRCGSCIAVWQGLSWLGVWGRRLFQ